MKKTKKAKRTKKIAPVAIDIGKGDKLASGAIRATFRMPSVDQKTWNKIFNKKPEPVKKAVYLFECPVHGRFASDREFFLSGGYPQLDELTTHKCFDENCDERAVYAGYNSL